MNIRTNHLVAPLTGSRRWRENDKTTAMKAALHVRNRSLLSNHRKYDSAMEANNSYRKFNYVA